MPADAIRTALARWRAATAYLAALTRRFDPAALDWPSACGDWINRQLLAHIATGYAMRRNWLRAALLGEPLIPRAAGDAANAERVAALASASRRVIAETLIANRAGIESLLAQLTEPMLDLAIERSHARGTLREALGDLTNHDLDHAAELRPLPASPP